jgi:hypothetical protein
MLLLYKLIKILLTITYQQHKPFNTLVVLVLIQLYIIMVTMLVLLMTDTTKIYPMARY